MHKHLSIISILFVALAMLCSCDRDVVYSDSHNIDETGWGIADTAHFAIDVADTTTVYDLFVDLRIRRTYPYSNAFLFLRTTFPDGAIAMDTLECPLAFDDGSWRGKEGARYVDNRYYFKHHVIFPQQGTYQFDITHGMRDTVAAGFKDIGLLLMIARQ